MVMKPVKMRTAGKSVSPKKEKPVSATRRKKNAARMVSERRRYS